MKYSLLNFASSFFLVISLFTIEPAEAHITLDPKMAVANTYTKLTFRVPHGCEGSPTKQLKVLVPEGFLSVKPQMKPGWKITVKKQKLETPAVLHGKEILEATREITWSGGLIPDDFMDEFSFSLKTPDRTGDIAFPVVQVCKKGQTAWSQVASEESADANHDHHKHHSTPAKGTILKFPAPVLSLVNADKNSGAK